MADILRFKVESVQLDEEIQRTFVDSSNIKSIWYEDGKIPGQGRLYIEFLSDAVYEYHRVPEWVVEFFLQAPSKGRDILRSLMVTLR